MTRREHAIALVAAFVALFDLFFNLLSGCWSSSGSDCVCAMTLTVFALWRSIGGKDACDQALRILNRHA